MREQKQAFLHDPANNIWGDCYRTAVACLLDLPRDSVPHVFHDGCKGPVADKRMNDWLGQRGMTQFVVALDGNTPLDQLLNSMLWANHSDVEYLLCGVSKNGTSHVVVCRGDAIVWDPAIDDSGITGPDPESGYWWITVIAVCNRNISQAVYSETEEAA